MQQSRLFPRKGGTNEREQSMVNVFLRAIVFGLGIEISREIYGAVRGAITKKQLARCEKEQVIPDTHDQPTHVHVKIDDGHGSTESHTTTTTEDEKSGDSVVQDSDCDGSH